MAQRPAPGLALPVFGLIAWVVAALFGAFPTTIDTQVAVNRGTGTIRAPSLSGPAAAAGFAVAGGLCFLGAGLAARATGRQAAAAGAVRGAQAGPGRGGPPAAANVIRAGVGATTEPRAAADRAGG